VNRFVTQVGSEAQARVVVGRLAEAGIHGWPSGSSRVGGMRDIYVDDVDWERAREVLQEAEDFSEAELIQAEEEDAARRAARQERRSEGA
jgi:Putative prokaryotic signal transducing protein